MRRELSKQLLVEVPIALFDQLQRECDTSGVTKGALVRRALEIYLGQLSSEATKCFIVELSEGASETLAAYREATDYPERSRLTERAIGDYVRARLEENKNLRERFEE